MIVVMSVQGALATPEVSRVAFEVVTSTAANYGQDAHFWWHSSGWDARYERLRNEYLPTIGAQAQQGIRDGKGAPRRSRPAPQAIETQQDRDRRIARIRIFPGDVEIRTGEQIIFNAVAYDQDGNAVGGLDTQWSALREGKNQPLTISAPGTFVSGVPGRFIVTAEIAGRKEQVKVTVTGEPRRASVKSRSEDSKSSHESRRVSSSRAPISGDRKQIAGKGAGTPALPEALQSASAPMAARSALFLDGDPDGWHSLNNDTAYDVQSERGQVPGHTVDGGAGSGNFQFAAPAVALDGRGIDLNLLFNYNSRVWHKAGSEITFNIDREGIAGWSLGFGKIVMAGDKYMLIDGDGTRHPFQGTLRRGFPSPASALQTFEGYTTDNTLIDYYAEGYQSQFDNSNGRNMIMAWAVMPNGTRIDYGAQANYAMYPTRITDAHGNFITITYRNNQGPDIQTITDTLGRVIQFFYDGSGLLTSIVVPGLGGGSRVAVRIQYQWLTLSNAGPNYGFTGGLTTKVRQNTIPVIRAIYYPGTRTGYWFGDGDSYSPYGMLRKLRECRAMTFDNAPWDQQGNIGAGSMSHELTYNYPQFGGSYSDMPTYTQMVEDWYQRMTDAPPVTQFSVVSGGGTLTTTITRPDGAQLAQTTDNNQNSPTYGMLLEDTLTRDGAVLSRSKSYWEIGAYNSPRPTRTEVTDERGRMKTTTFSYWSYNQVGGVWEYGYQGQLLRRHYTEYLHNSNYIGHLANSGTLWWKQGGGLSGGPAWNGPHIFNLVTLTEVVAGDDVTRLSRTEYQYDGAGLMDAPGIVQHNPWYNPHTPPDVICEEVSDPNDVDCVGCPPAPMECPIGDGECNTYEICNTYPRYDARTWYRGNVTQVKSYAEAAILNQDTTAIEARTYDIAGNVRTQAATCCEQATFNYTTNTQYAWPESELRGSASDQAAQNTTSDVYDFNTGLVIGSYNENGRYSNTVYNPDTLRPEYEYSPTGAYVYHRYFDDAPAVWEYVYEAGKSGGDYASHVDKYLDGKGRLYHQFDFAWDNGVVTDETRVVYDNMGRAQKRSRPFRTESNPTILWTTYEYDALDRPVKVTAPDGSLTQNFYNEMSQPSAATSNAGPAVRSRDAWGRERWSRFDENERLVELVEPNPSGDGTVASGGMSTRYHYDALGGLTQVNQGSQTRHFRYDSLGRLTHQKLAERDSTLNDNGQWVGAGQWSDVFFYDRRSNLTRRVDARGVQTRYDFNDPLNRPLSVEYDKSGTPGHLSANIPDTPKVIYGYVTSGDKNRVENISVINGIVNEQLSYDSEGRLAQVRQIFTERASQPLYANYIWDSLDQLKENTYPQQYGAGEIRKKVEPSYDIASRIQSLKFGGVNYASNPVYNASGQTTSMSVGGQMVETYGYDPQTGLMTSQKVKQGANTLVDLKYNYTLNNDQNNSGAKTGHLTGVTDLKNTARNRAYEYDKLGRLTKVKGGADAFSNPAWHQNYAYDRHGNRGSVSSTPAETVWVDDVVPAGAAAGGGGGDSWNWVSSSPDPKSGSVSHQSNNADWSNWSPAPYSGNVSHQSNISSGVHQHYYHSSSPIPVRQGGKLYAYVYMDPEYPPQELMLQWGTPTDGWEHRAYWGANILGWGTDGTNSRRYMGPLPQAGGWVRLEVPASAVGLEGMSVNAIAFSLFGGRANWDLAGVEGTHVWTEEICDFVCPHPLMECYWDCTYIPHENYENYVLVDDSFPSGATPGADGGDGWNWRGASNVELVHQHFFYNATDTMQVNAGDKLYTWAYVDPASPPQEMMLQWHENGNWEHRAYWGANKIGWGTDGTASRRYMGPLPSAGGWVKLEVPASSVGLEGKTVNGMAFTLYGGRVTWDKAGKTNAAGGGPPAPVMGRDGFENLAYNTENNRIITAGFEYDPAGNQTRAVVNASGGQQQYRYDCANRLAQVLDGSGNVLATYGYGAGNQRLKSVEGSVTKYFAWAGGQLLAEYEASGASALIWKTSYVYLGARLLATTSGSAGAETQFHHPNQLGTRLATNAEGTVVSEQLSMPFGTMLPFTQVYGGENSYQHPTLNNPSKKRFTSYDRSEATNLDYAVNRHYSSAQGRFTQVDPIDMDAADLDDPQTLNLYAYCGNDPINHVDPEGLFFGKLWRGIKKFFSNIYVKIAVLVALTVISIGAAAGKWALFTTAVDKGLAFKIGGEVMAGVATGAAAGTLPTVTALGWATAALSALSGVSLPGGFGGYGGFRTPPINPGAVEQYIVPQRGRRGGDRRQNPPRLTTWRNLPRRGGREARRPSASTTDPSFPNLRDHASRHGGGMSREEYFAAARGHIASYHPGSWFTQKFRAYHDGQWKWYYVTKVGPNNYIFTSTTLNGRVILTHMRDKVVGGSDSITRQYLLNKGVNPPMGF